MLAFEGGYGGMVVADGGLATLACCVRRDRLDALRAQATGARAGDVVEAMLRQACGGVRDALRGARREGPWIAAGPLDPGVRLGGVDGLLRIGNAAGEAHPIIGEGISMALQGAALACAHLLGAADRAADVGTAAAARDRLRRGLARPLRAAAAPGGGVLARGDAAGQRRGPDAAGTALAGPADPRRALGRQDPRPGRRAAQPVGDDVLQPHAARAGGVGLEEVAGQVRERAQAEHQATFVGLEARRMVRRRRRGVGARWARRRRRRRVRGRPSGRTRSPPSP